MAKRAHSAPPDVAEEVVGPKPLAALLPTSKVRDRLCAKHGPYQEKVIALSGRTITQSCPKCLLEQEAHETARRRDDSVRAAKQTRAESLFQQSGVPERYREASFDTYQLYADKEASARQRLALNVCRKFALNFAAVQKHGGNLLLQGNSGTGKTHLACAISNHLVQQGYSSMFVTAAAITHRIASARGYSSKADPEEIYRELASLDLLVIDEIEEFDGVDAKVTLIRVVNERYAADRPTVVLTNLELHELLERLSVKTVDRLSEGGQLVVFNWDSYRKMAGAGTPRWMEDV